MTHFSAEYVYIAFKKRWKTAPKSGERSPKNLLQIDIFILATLEAEGKNAILVTRDGPLKKHADALQMPCMHIDELPDPNDIIPEPLPAPVPEPPIPAPALKPKQMGIFDGMEDVLSNFLAEGVKAEIVLTDKPAAASTDPKAEAKANGQSEYKFIESAEGKPVPSESPVQSPPEPVIQTTQEQLDKPKRRVSTKPKTESKAQPEEP